MNYQLKALAGQYEGELLGLTAERLILGRNPSEAHLIFSSDKVEISGTHLLLWLEGKRIMAQDCSKNGTFFGDGRPFPKNQSIELAPGTQFYLVNRQELFEITPFGSRGVTVGTNSACPVQPNYYANNFSYSETAIFYAGFWRRVVAQFLDWIIIGVPLAIFQFFIWLPLFGTLNPAAPEVNYFVAMVTGNILSIILSFFCSWLYAALMESSSHMATLGKQAVSIYVCDQRGQRLSFGQATGRYLAKSINWLIPLFLGFLMSAFTDKKQTLHDFIVGNEVRLR